MVWADGTCSHCQKGETNLCEKRVLAYGSRVPFGDDDGAPGGNSNNNNNTDDHGWGGFEQGGFAAIKVVDEKVRTVDIYKYIHV